MFTVVAEFTLYTADDNKFANYTWRGDRVVDGSSLEN